jgi:hypothetical protein
MTFAAGFFGAIGICAFATLAFLIIIAWRKDRTRRSQKALEQEHSVILPLRRRSGP